MKRSVGQKRTLSRVFFTMVILLVITPCWVSSCKAEEKPTEKNQKEEAQQPPASPPSSDISEVKQTPVPLPASPNFIVELAKRYNPAVVNISTTRIIKRKKRPTPGPFFRGPEHFRDFFGEDFFDQFFGDSRPREYKRNSLGSGFIIDKEGYILTNNHVIENADEIIVTINDEKEYHAKPVGRDKKTDLGLIKLDEGPEDLFTVMLGDSDVLEVGEWVVAIGNPFGLGHTVTAGIVSAKGRVIGAGPYDDFIQTDASINPGNSGGPLFNSKGEVVGINTAIVATGQGIGFAIPINVAKELLIQLKETGHVVRGWLGVHIQKVTPELAESFGMKEPQGALIANVFEDTPAEKAGVEAGDIILEFDGKEIEEYNDLPRIVAATPVGKKVEMKVLREGVKKDLKVEVGQMEEEVTAEGEKEEEQELGMVLHDITPEIEKQFRLSQSSGVVVLEVEAGSTAADADIRVGDVIAKVKGEEVKNVKELKNILSTTKKGEVIRMTIKRKDATLFIAFRK